MKHVAYKSIACVLVLGCACVTSHDAYASGPYVLQRSVIAGGGSPISGGTYQITSTIGQSTIAVRAALQYIVFDGFWGPVGGFAYDLIFADGFDGL